MTWHIIGEGDSIVKSGEPSGDPSYVRLLPAEYAPEPTLSMFAEGGTNMSDMEARWPTVLADIQSHVADDFVILLIAMGNGLIEVSHDPDALYARYLAYIDQALASQANVRVVPCSLLPRDQLGWNDRPARTDFNALVGSDPARISDYANFDGQWFAEQSATENPDWYPDGIHPLAPVYEAAVPLVKVATDNVIHPNRPQLITPPALSGQYYYGGALAVSDGQWSEGSVDAYQWFCDGVPIAGATSSTYTLQPADVGCVVKCNVRATSAGATVWTASNDSPPIDSDYGPEIVENGTFDTDVSGWELINGASLTRTGDGWGRLTNETGQSLALMRQTRPCLDAVWYRVTFDVRFAVGNYQTSHLTQQLPNNHQILIDEDGTYGQNLLSISDSIYFDFRDSTNPTPAPAGSAWDYDNISCRQLIPREIVVARNISAFAPADLPTPSLDLVHPTTDVVAQTVSLTQSTNAKGRYRGTLTAAAGDYIGVLKSGTTVVGTFGYVRVRQVDPEEAHAIDAVGVPDGIRLEEAFTETNQAGDTHTVTRSRP